MNRHPHDNTDVLDHATDALRGAPVPPGPPAEVLATVSALDGRVQPTVQFKTRSFPMRRILSIAAAVLLFVGVAAVAYHLFGGSATVAFAEVRQQIEQAQTMKCHIGMDITMPQAPGPIDVVWYHKSPGQMRQEATIAKTGEKAITTFDFQSGRALTLAPATKQAMVIDMGQFPQAIRDKQVDFVAEMKKMVQGDAEELGFKEIDGQRVKGFRVAKNSQVIDIWVNPKTGTPVAMEMTMPGLGAMRMDGFVFGEEMDDALFSVVPPPGYQVTNLQMPMGNPSEEDLVAGLKFLTELNDNTFPELLTPTPQIIQKLKERESQNKAKDKGLSEQEQVQKAMEIATPLVRMNIYVQMVKDLHYVGAGVKLGDAGRIICRYKPPGKETYRVIYGDLRVADAPTEPQSP